MISQKLLETLADISYIAGYEKYYSGDSRADIREYIWWAEEFERIHANTNWDKLDYILTIDAFTENKINMSIENRFNI